jgi:diguanylate cyclase (GGDEF)-like protein
MVMRTISNSIHPERASVGNLRTLTTLIAAGVAAAGAVLLIIIAYAGWTSNHSSLERERTLLQNGINRRIARTLNEQKSVAWWDDAVTKITETEVDVEFADSEFGVLLSETYGHDEVYILSGNDQPLYAFSRHRRRAPESFERLRPYLKAILSEVRSDHPSGLTKRPDTFSEDQNSYRTMGDALKAARWSGHLLSVNGRASLVTALTIVPTIDMSLLEAHPKVLFSIKYIDEAFIHDLGKTLLLKDLAVVPHPVAKDGVYSEQVITDEGTYGGYIAWTMERPGQVLLTSILPLVGLGVLGAGLLASGMMRRLKRSADDLADREQQSHHDARHDALSDLPNRMHFSEKLSAALGTLPDAEGEQVAVVAYVDIDRFKDVNDTLGHHAGDELIKAVATRLQQHLRPGDVLSRYGGDEFAILWVSSTGAAIDRLAERIERAFATRFDVHGQSLSVTASTGIALARSRATTADELMRRADIALYEAKTQGRNRAVKFVEDMAQRVEERRAIELDLRTALDEGQLRLNYQPILSCATGEISGVEALLRWRHPQKGEIPPGRFIAIAEQSGLMPELGTWVLRQAMEDWWRWPQLQVSVNLSPVQFRQADILDVLQTLLAETRVTPGRFVLEITEGVLMESTDRSSRTLEAIRGMGFLSALDDFGTGYSSLSYLCHFKFDKIKIDRSFVAGMSKSDGYRKIVRSVIALGKGLGMSIVAEGVETEDEVRAMAGFGCNELQGYYFSKPLETDAMLRFLHTHVAKPIAVQLGTDEPPLLSAAG